MSKNTLTDVISVLENIQVPSYSMGIPNYKPETIGYSATYSLRGISVKLKGNSATKRYQKMLNGWGEIVKGALIQEFGSQVECYSLGEFIVKETDQPK